MTYFEILLSVDGRVRPPYVKFLRSDTYHSNNIYHKDDVNGIEDNKVFHCGIFFQHMLKEPLTVKVIFT